MHHTIDSIKNAMGGRGSWLEAVSGLAAALEASCAGSVHRRSAVAPDSYDALIGPDTGCHAVIRSAAAQSLAALPANRAILATDQTVVAGLPGLPPCLVVRLATRGIDVVIFAVRAPGAVPFSEPDRVLLERIVALAVGHNRARYRAAPPVALLRAVVPGVLVALLATAGGVRAADGSVKLDLTGTIAESCGITVDPGDAALTVDLSVAGSAMAGFSVACNTPMEFTLKATRGALENTAAIEHNAADFTDSVDYTANFTVATTGTSVGTTGAAMKAGGGVTNDTGGAVPYDSDATLTVNWTRDGRALLAGDYTEIVTITVAVDTTP